MKQRTTIPIVTLFLLVACRDHHVAIEGSVGIAAIPSTVLGSMATMNTSITGPVVCSSQGETVTCSPRPGAPARTTPTPPTQPPIASTANANVCPELKSAPQGPVADAIGDITMLPDGTLVENLVARGGGAIGHAQRTYKKGEPKYEEHLRHVGGLNPCETKLIPPWN